MKIIKYITKNRTTILWVICLLSIVYLTLFYKSSGVDYQIPHIDKIAHFMMFFSITSLGSMIILKKYNNRMRFIIINFIASVSLGGLIEIIQPYFGRGADFIDFYADVLGAIVGVIMYKFIYFKIIKRILK